MTGRHQHRIPADRLRDALDGDLLGLWLEGHREGLDELVRRHHAWLLRTVRLLSHGERDREAIVQDVWVDVMCGAPDLPRGRTGAVLAEHHRAPPHHQHLGRPQPQAPHPRRRGP